MRFPKKRYTTARRVPTNAPSPVSESTDPVASLTAERRESARVPAQPRAASEPTAASADPTSARPKPVQPSGERAAAAPSADLPEELIAARAYEIWKRRGCPMGQDSERDWYAARAELEAERMGWTQAQPGDRNRI